MKFKRQALLSLTNSDIISVNGKLPNKDPIDYQFLNKQTEHTVCYVGLNTFLDLPEEMLKSRSYIVVTNIVKEALNVITDFTRVNELLDYKIFDPDLDQQLIEYLRKHMGYIRLSQLKKFTERSNAITHQDKFAITSYSLLFHILINSPNKTLGESVSKYFCVWTTLSSLNPNLFFNHFRWIEHISSNIHKPIISLLGGASLYTNNLIYCDKVYISYFNNEISLKSKDAIKQVFFENFYEKFFDLSEVIQFNKFSLNIYNKNIYNNKL